MNIAHSLGLCGTYAVSSILLSFTMKFLFKVFHFQNASLLLTLEAITDVVICSFVMYKKEKLSSVVKEEKFLASFKKFWLEKLRNTKRTLPLSLLHLANMLCGIKGLERVSIPMFLALRRSLVVFVLLADRLAGSGKKIRGPIFLSVALISLGALIAGDLNNNWVGYIYVIVNNIITASMLQISKMFYDDMKIEPINVVYNNSVSVIPLLIFYLIATNNFVVFSTWENSYQEEFLICLALVCLISFFHHYMIFYCANTLSPLAIALTHNFKDIFSTTMGLILFRDLVINEFLIGGLLVSFSGAFLYSYSKITEGRKMKVVEACNEPEGASIVIDIEDREELNLGGKKGE